MNARGLYALTALNLVLVGFALAPQIRAANAQADTAVLRGRALEIVDAQGRVRASIGVLPSGADTQAETVLLRLITEQGRPTVKIGASEPTSGLSFAGPTGTKNTYLVLQARNSDTSLLLRNEDGRERVVTP